MDFVSCQYTMLSGRGLCDGLINRPEESHRDREIESTCMCFVCVCVCVCVSVCGIETSTVRQSRPELRCSAINK